MIVIIGSATCVLLMLVVCFLLYREIGRLRGVKQKVETKRKELQGFYARDPFPSPANVDAFRQNCTDLDKEMSQLMKRMSKGQIQMKADQEPLEWLTMLTRMQKDLIDRAYAKSVGLANTSFGFGKYGEGTPPSRADVPRLTLQVKIVDAVCGLLYEAGIKELLGIDREMFEGGAMTAGLAAHGGEVTADTQTNSVKSLLSEEHMSLRFKAKETALVNVLNSFASADMLIVVTGIWMRGEPAVVLEAAPVASDSTWDSALAATSKVARAVGEIDERPRDQRIVSGRSKESPATITVNISVYRFVEGDVVEQPVSEPSS